MIAKHVTTDEMFKALRALNGKYQDNVRFRDQPVWQKGGYNFRLTVVAKDGAGTRLAPSGWRKVGGACWHVHGHFFEELFKVNPEAVVISGGTLKITKDYGNWEDRNIGSQACPRYFSEACDCSLADYVDALSSDRGDVGQAVGSLDSEKFMDVWGSYKRTHGPLLVANCPRTVLALLINEQDETLKALISKRLKSRK